MSNKQQSSSIDFFWNQLPEILPFTVDTETAVKLWGAFEQAKAMHKTEHFNTWWHGISENEPITFEQYYTYTFGGKNEQQ